MSNYKNIYNPEDTNHSWSVALEYIEDKSTVLEVGCGNGCFAEALIDLKGCSVDAIEPDRGDAVLAQKIVPNIIIGTVEESLPLLKGKTYDYIIFLDVIEHLADPIATLVSLRSHLNHNGKIVFSIPNMAHTSVRIMLLNGKFHWGKTGLLDGTHLHFYTEDEIHHIFNEAGYYIDSISGTVEMYSPQVIVRELKKIGIHSPTSDLINVLSSHNGHIYQYIGAAMTGSGRKRSYKLPESSPEVHGTIKEYDKETERYIKRTIRHFKGIIKAKDEQIATLHYQKEEVSRELNELANLREQSIVSRLKKIVRGR